MGSFKARMKGPPLIVVSFCDGIGSSMLALEWIWGTPRCQMPWVRGISGKESFKKEVEEILGK